MQIYFPDRFLLPFRKQLFHKSNAMTEKWKSILHSQRDLFFHKEFILAGERMHGSLDVFATVINLQDMKLL